MRGESVKVDQSTKLCSVYRNKMEFLDVNLLKILLFSMTFFIVVMGSLVNWFEKHLPVFFPQTFRYGKFAYKGKPSPFKVIEVPKSWFKHFYVFSSIYSLYALHLVIDVYLYGAKTSKGLNFYLDFLEGTSRKTNCGSTSVIIALSLMTLQSFRRFYETWFVSVFSKGRINATHYMVGFLHYWATITIILAEASGFKEGKKIIDDGLNYFQILGIVIFAYAWINQYNSNLILANLRKNARGHVVSTQHKIPRGGLFEYISSPHLTCEVLIYLSLWMILWNNFTFKYVFLWVLSNQECIYQIKKELTVYLIFQNREINQTVSTCPIIILPFKSVSQQSLLLTSAGILNSDFGIVLVGIYVKMQGYIPRNIRK